MNTINVIVTRAADVLMTPAQLTSPLAMLLILSVVCGLLMTIVFKYTSNQKALKVVADRTKAQLLCMRLFKDDLRVAIRCQASLVKYIGLRLWHSLPPMLVMIVPFVLILPQLAMRYEWRGLEPGESIVAMVQIDPAAWDEHHDDVSLRVPPGVVIETPRLRDAEEHAIYWRLRLEHPTIEPIVFSVGYYGCPKTFANAEDPRELSLVSPRRPGPGFLDRLLYPAEPGFASDGPVRGVELRYPGRSTPIFGLDVPWWLTFFVVTMIAALVARPFLRVQF